MDLSNPQEREHLRRYWVERIFFLARCIGPYDRMANYRVCYWAATGYHHWFPVGEWIETIRIEVAKYRRSHAIGGRYQNSALPGIFASVVVNETVARSLTLLLLVVAQNIMIEPYCILVCGDTSFGNGDGDGYVWQGETQGETLVFGAEGNQGQNKFRVCYGRDSGSVHRVKIWEAFWKTFYAPGLFWRKKRKGRQWKLYIRPSIHSLAIVTRAL
ncbi:MAG: hypothetical protein NXY57DRAFT_1037094 [Lentinula lateritia]|nr:MAG: hypothetical protein NXY57DRAFT_1037094 [Lentinula lateritia]